MAQPKATTRLPVITVEDETAHTPVVLPTFTFEPYAASKPHASRKQMDEIDADLVLMTKLYRMEIPAALHWRHGDAADQLKGTIKEEFPGKKGTFKLVEVPHSNAQGISTRRILLYGLGPASSFCGQTACGVFQTLFEQALKHGAESVLIPFIPNRMTKNSLTHKATAFKLKTVLMSVLQSWDGPISLREVKIYCAPPAVQHIQAGLAIDQGDACMCRHKH